MEGSDIKALCLMEADGRVQSVLSFDGQVSPWPDEGKKKRFLLKTSLPHTFVPTNPVCVRGV